ncbi:complement factor H-related protein 5-like isoform X2 [Engystomops pustulosus]|uniref:complement factor H-related protein 5-like isoform X2 n=1 Tax=Engystomops pustulosus TaxID=76066 RepID=UPI003AFB0C51
MSAVILLILLISAMSCCAAPSPGNGLCTYNDTLVENAQIMQPKSEYTEGEKVQFQCNNNFQTTDGTTYGERTCLSNGQFTPAKCSGKSCERPDIEHGSLYKWYWFPKNNGEYIYYSCETNYLPRHWTRIDCTNTGWNPEPKCLRVCKYSESFVENAQIMQLKSEYTEGEKVHFQCNNNFITSDGKTNGERTCLSNGKFTPAKCSRTCKTPQQPNARFTPSKNEYEIGEYLQYECDKGYMTQSRNLLGIAECLNERWSETPHCIAITCEHDGVSYKDGEVAEFTCPQGQRPESDFGQCFYYGWGPPPICQDQSSLVPDSVPSLPDSKDKPEKGKKCPLAYSPKNAEIIDPKKAYYNNDGVTMICRRGYTMIGFPIIQCLEGKWEHPPQCIPLKPCSNPPSMIPNGALADSSVREIYVTDDVVKYVCKRGFHISGSDQSTCINGLWTALPTCIEYLCDEAPEVQHATVTEKKKTYIHSERAKYKCEKGFRFSENDAAICTEGKWMEIPLCIITSCGPPPVVPNSIINGPTKEIYESGEKVTYLCNSGHSLVGSEEALCKNTIWINLPVCGRTGAECGPSSQVQYGDTLENRKTSYKSGETVTYKCPEYYILQGDSKVKCMHGVWGEAPKCIEPCTAKEKDMQQNNIQLKWTADNKLYLQHGDSTEFQCKSGYKALSDTKMRVRCEHGKLEYPKCFKIA